MFGPSEIPSVGKVELSWVPNPPISTSASNGDNSSFGKEGEDSIMENAAGTNGHENVNEVDYDVADDEDSWGIGL